MLLSMLTSRRRRDDNEKEEEDDDEDGDLEDEDEDDESDLLGSEDGGVLPCLSCRESASHFTSHSTLLLTRAEPRAAQALARKVRMGCYSMKKVGS